METININDLRDKLKDYMPSGVESYMLVWAIEEANSLGHSLVEYYFSREPDITLIFKIPYPGSNEIQVYGLRIFIDKSLMDKLGLRDIIRKEVKGVLVESCSNDKINIICEVKGLDDGLRVVKSIIRVLQERKLHSGRVEILGYNTLLEY
ncbi:MAG TPA: hypothetical protein EYH40_01175 [Desulfurococcales archaeon]|nr:hypothetical protein [Desulfurococcales archaeon]